MSEVTLGLRSSSQFDEQEAQRGKPVSGRRKRSFSRWKPYLYVLPAFAVFAVFIGVPLGQSFWYSFWNWNGLSKATWAGVHNYIAIFTDPLLKGSFVHALILLVFFSGIPVIGGLLLTAVLGRARRMRGLGLFKVVVFLPQVVSLVAVATIWAAIYAPDGLLNQVLNVLGLGSLRQPWLGSFQFALPAVGVIGTWLNLGLCMVLFISGAAAIPAELYEAARLDGAGVIREFRSITLPGIRGQLASALILTIISGLKTFDLIYISTSGGPGESTTVPAYEVYNLAFNQDRVGTAAALGIALTIVISLITVAINFLQPGKAE
jgi:raffinose/stachyose/melibiose transport system permease protein